MSKHRRATPDLSLELLLLGQVPTHTTTADRCELESVITEVLNEPEEHGGDLEVLAAVIAGLAYTLGVGHTRRDVLP